MGRSVSDQGQRMSNKDGVASKEYQQKTSVNRLIEPASNTFDKDRATSMASIYLFPQTKYLGLVGIHRFCL